MKLLKEKGFGMVEVLMSFAILGAGIYTIMAGLDFLESKKANTDKNVSMELLVSSVVESIRSNIIMEKVDFDASASWLANTTYNDVTDSLKMCWNERGIFPATSQPDCPGRIGYVVAPFKTGNLEIRGLYLVTIRLVNTKLFPNEFKQYEFIVRGP